MKTVEETTEGNLIIRIPMCLRTCSGRRRVIVAAENTTPQNAIRDKVLQAVVRARQWQKDMNEGVVTSTSELASRLGVDRSYVSRLLHLNELSPKIIRMILLGTAPDSISLERLAKVKTMIWEEQEQMFGIR